MSDDDDFGSDTHGSSSIASTSPHAAPKGRTSSTSGTLSGYLAGIAVVSVSTLVAWLLFGRAELPDVTMLLVLGVVIVAMRFGYGPSLLAAVLSVISFDFFFVTPYLSFAVSDFRHIVTFVVMFIVAVVISHLMKRIRDQAESARQREARTVRLAEEARRVTLQMETEQLRNALLSSVSHDLRTPLAVITGATSALLEEAAPNDEATRRELLETVHEEALRLNRLVRNLLDMTRLEAGALKVNKNLESLEEIVGGALNRMEDRLRGRAIKAEIPVELPLLPLDPVLMEQVFINLLENATKYTPPEAPIDIIARQKDNAIEIDVADRGPGVPVAEAERIFEKFYRAREREGGGVGLGLTICRGIVTAHGGRIAVVPRSGGGSVFRIALPLPPEPTCKANLTTESERFE